MLCGHPSQTRTHPHVLPGIWFDNTKLRLGVAVAGWSGTWNTFSCDFSVTSLSLVTGETSGVRLHGNGRGYTARSSRKSADDTALAYAV